MLRREVFKLLGLGSAGALLPIAAAKAETVSAGTETVTYACHKLTEDMLISALYDYRRTYGTRATRIWVNEAAAEDMVSWIPPGTRRFIVRNPEAPLPMGLRTYVDGGELSYYFDGSRAEIKLMDVSCSPRPTRYYRVGVEGRLPKRRPQNIAAPATPVGPPTFNFARTEGLR
jgi:hypothetical protein